jgi:uncharacterized membrane protein HdeD (DUF308 family)
MRRTEIQKVVRGTWWALVIRGVFAILVGVLVLTRPLESVGAFALVIALWALVQGVVNVVHALGLRSAAPHWWMLLVSGIVSAGFGIAALYYYPALSLTFAVVWAAWWLLVSGGLGVYAAVQERRMSLPWGWTLTWGLLSVVAGVMAFASPPVTLAALLALMATFAFVGGLALLFAAYRLRQVEGAVSAALRTA